MAMLEVKDLEVYYGMIQAIKGISFEVNKGEVIALIGANGAGKTTTLQTITGLLAPKEGKVLFEGKDITKIPAHKIVSMGMAHVPEGRRVFAELSVYENLKLGEMCIRDRNPASLHPPRIYVEYIHIGVFFPTKASLTSATSVEPGIEYCDNSLDVYKRQYFHRVAS